MSRKPFPIVCIACKIFKSELEALRKKGEFNFPVYYLDSMLHMHPAKLQQHLDTLIIKELEAGKKILLLYGDCHAYMSKHDSTPGVCRVSGINCPEIILGKDKYSSLRKQGAFFLMPEWTIRWQEVFQDELKLNRENARAFMREMHTKLIYLDTGHTPVPTDHLKAVSDYSGLPWEVMTISTNSFLNAINEAIDNKLR